jgi:serine/alanine adding enzyme
MMQIVHHLPEDMWRDYVKNHSQGNIFHTPEMFEVFARIKRHQPTLWAVINDNNQPLVLFLPVEVTLIGGLARHLTTRAVLYGSILSDLSPIGQEALVSLLQAYRQAAKGRLLFTELRNLSNLAPLQPLLQQNGFVYEDHLDYLINLNRPTDEILQNIGQRTRKKIRKGLRDGLVHVTEVTQRAELDQWYHTLQKTYTHAQVPLADRALFEAAFDILYPQGMAKFLLAWVNGVIAACSVELPYKDTIYGWYGGSDRAYSDFYPNELLIWHILEWGTQHGYKVYDFGGAGKPDEEYGVRDFKAKFGGELVCFGRNTCIHVPRLLKLSTWGYHFYRHWLKRS